MDSGNHYHIKHQQWHSGFFLQHEQEDKEFIQRRWDDAVEAVWPKDRPYAPSKMDVALADFHSHCLPFLLAEDPKLVQLIQVTRTLGSTYKPPSRDLISGKYLDVIHETSWKQQLALLLSEARIYGVNVFGNGTTIKTVVLVNVLVLHVLDVLLHRGCNVKPVPVGLSRASCDVSRLTQGVLVVVLHGSPRDASFW